MAQKLWKNLVFLGVACLMMVASAFVQPPIEPQDCEGINIIPFRIGDNSDKKD